MNNLATWFLDNFKPWFRFVSIYIGMLTVYFGIAYLCRVFLNIEIYITIIALVFGGVLLDQWAKNLVLDSMLKELITDEDHNIKIITDSDGKIDRQKLNSIVFQIEKQIKLEGLNEEKENFRKKIENAIWKRYSVVHSIHNK